MKKGLKHDLVYAVNTLRIQADDCLESTRVLLRSHESHARAMAILFESTASRRSGKIRNTEGLVQIGEQILAQSAELAKLTEEMLSQLQFCLQLLERLKTLKEKRRRSRALRWLSHVLRLLEVVFKAGVAVFPVLGDPLILTIGCAVAAPLADAMVRLIKEHQECKCVAMP